MTVWSGTHRVFTDSQYVAAGAAVQDDVSPASVILGVKEVPVELLIPNRTCVCSARSVCILCHFCVRYMFFGHVIKAQPHRYNVPPRSTPLLLPLTLSRSMKMLDTMLRHNIRFIDYEAIRARSPDGRCKRLQPLCRACAHPPLSFRSAGDRLVAFGRLAGVAGGPPSLLFIICSCWLISTACA